DIQPHPGLVASLVKTAIAQGYDLVSLSPQFILKYPGECWIFWLSPLADPLAVLRIFLSAFHTPKEWRGRKYGD
ncbi:hypothetical protein MEN24_20675, partial [Dolichospermum sp. ST_sed10]|nr:hypothetical protein [Dolichospermum sp. ST_sed10]